MRFSALLVICFVFCFSCKEKSQNTVEITETPTKTVESIKYAKGFTITNYGDYKNIKVTSPWPNSNTSYSYLLVNKGAKIPDHEKPATIIQTPIERVVVMSTTNIPALEYLNSEACLVGFPNTDYISSEKTRTLIKKGLVKDIGKDININMELLLELKPELVIGFSVNGNNKTYNQIEKLNIPIVLDGAWVEQHPLGRAEWIKFVAAFFNKTDEANTLFNQIEKDYFLAKEIASKSKTTPTVFSGSAFKDVWNVPGGKSFVAKYLKDANTSYIWENNTQTGSLKLNFENVLVKAKDADLWIGAGNFENKVQMETTNRQYTLFDAYKNNQVYTYTNKKGSKSGLLYFELGPLRPDLILKDIIKISHPNLLENYEPFFFKRLN